MMYSGTALIQVVSQACQAAAVTPQVLKTMETTASGGRP